MAHDATVFVVDDHDSVRASLRAFLSAVGLHVADYASADAFLEQATAERGDCILADMRMPGMTGLELQEELTRRGSAVPVIIITGHADVSLAVKAMKAGAADFIEKPYDNDTLLDSVRRALEISSHARVQAEDAKVATDLIMLLTDRERDVLSRLVLGQSNKIVAHELGISPRTVEVHRARIQSKMQARGLSDLVRIAHAAEMREPV